MSIEKTKMLSKINIVCTKRQKSNWWERRWRKNFSKKSSTDNRFNDTKSREWRKIRRNSSSAQKKQVSKTVEFIKFSREFAFFVYDTKILYNHELQCVVWRNETQIFHHVLLFSIIVDLWQIFQKFNWRRRIVQFYRLFLFERCFETINSFEFFEIMNENIFRFHRRFSRRWEKIFNFHCEFFINIRANQRNWKKRAKR